MEDWQKKYYANRMHQSNIQQKQQTAITNMTARNSNISTCSIREGALLYRPVETNGFGSTAVIVVAIGQAPSNYTSMQFEYRQTPSNCYLLENQMQVIDMGKINEKKTLQLIEVSAPFIGRFFIQESNVLKHTQYTQGINSKTILQG